MCTVAQQLYNIILNNVNAHNIIIPTYLNIKCTIEKISTTNLNKIKYLNNKLNK